MWKDFKWVEKRFGTKFANILKGVKDIAEEGGQEISNHFITSETGEVTFKDLDDNNHVLVTTEALQDEDSPVKELFDESVASVLTQNGLIEVKWQKLKNKRDNGQLIPGSLYCITDYQCTTVQENTRSAGHQFDIVLLALSENKLAEEGWAMEHSTDVYDVTFRDGVTVKCYIYMINETSANVVFTDTLIGADFYSVNVGEIGVDSDLVVDFENKTAVADFESYNLDMENLTYNYFQNSNLSAWKVWYCLDNDTDRFAWADDRNYLIATQDSDNIKYYRNASEDIVESGLYAWVGFFDGSDVCIYTKVETPNTGDKLYDDIGDETGTNIKLVSNDGRGVIYRLIDEWNNDVAYDFKNIQFVRKLDGGQIDEQGTDTYCYTFTLYDLGNEEYKDASIFAIDYVNDEEGITPCYNNSINSISAYNSPIDYTNKYSYALPCIIFLSSVESGSYGWGAHDNKLFDVHASAFEGNCSRNIVFGGGRDYTDLIDSFVCYAKRASMEFI